MQAERTGRYTAAMPSRASPLPQGGLASREFSWSCITCGSWLACDAGGADWQVHRSDAIASKPAPTKVPGTPRIQLVMHYLWEQACLRCRRRGLAGTPQRCHREQARSHRGAWQAANSVGHALPVGAGLPAMQTARTGRYTAAMPSRASPLPQGGLASREFSWSCITCGSRLACDADGADWQVHRSDAIASKPAPTGGGWHAANSVGHALPVGAGLPAMQAARTGRYTAAMPSRASPLPQGGAGKPRIQLVMHYLWEQACLRCRRRGLAGAPQRCHREQARSHRGGAGTPRIQLVMHYLWELACLRCRRRGLAGTPQRCRREQARSHRGGGFRFIRSTKIPSGKKSARPNPAGAANRPAPAGR
jgi:hypothetical protein